MELLTFKKHNGKEYLYADFRGLTDDENLMLASRLTRLIKRRENNSVRLIIDGRGVVFSYARFSYARETAKIVQKYIKKSCYITSRPISPTIIKIYRKFSGSKAQFFLSLDEAILYVTS